MVKVFSVIETNRFILREVNAEDAKDMFSYLSDPEVVKHMGLEPFQTQANAQDEISWYLSIYDEDSGIRWGIT
jgi:ribosomal-protein-alanine N-acetyltransferase